MSTRETESQESNERGQSFEDDVDEKDFEAGTVSEDRSSGVDTDTDKEYIEKAEDASETETTAGPQLAIEQAKKIRITAASTESTVPDTESSAQSSRKRPIEAEDHQSDEDSDPTNFKTSTQNKKVPGKLIDKLWEYSDQATIDSLEKVLNLSINKTIERYKPNGFQNANKLSKKMTDAETVLFNAWLNSNNSKSFRSRLSTTKLPKLHSMHPGTNVRSDENAFILNYDKLSQRKNFFETYLAAEMRQLFELENYYNKLKLNYQSDCNYLREFKRTVSVSQAKMSDEIVDKNKEFNFDEFPKSQATVQIRPSNTIKYNPSLDNEPTRQVLADLRDSLVQLTSRSEPVTNFNDKLQTFSNLLDMI